MLASVVFDKMKEELKNIPERFQSDVEKSIDACIDVIISCRPCGAGKSAKIQPDIVPFLEQDLKLKTLLSRYLDSTSDIQPKDVVLRLCQYWSEFTTVLTYVVDPERNEFFTTFHPAPTGGVIKVTCCDASKMLLECYDEYDQVIAFSATLKPFDFYAKLSGLSKKNLKTAEFQSPYQKENRKLLIIPQISTKYSDRDRNYPKISETVRRVVSIRPGNYFIFFPSFVFLEKVLDIFQTPPGFKVYRQEREMRAADVDDLLEQLKLQSAPSLVFAVQGGVFSEGVDYPGDMIIGAFVVGPPLPNFDLEREEMRQYYEKNYGSGFDYAYTYPAMAKAVQAAGRVIRSETDRGLIVLMDSRFINSSYTQSMPTDWFEKSAMELVSNSILKEVSDFWDHQDKTRSGSAASGQ
jgi:DNA excision repair protein ERCC-2